MNSQNILYIFIVLVIFNFLFTTVLDYLNDKNWKDEIPDDLKDFTAYILWAVDKKQQVLVGSGANRTETVESIREFYANDEAKASLDRHNLEE